MIKYIEGNVFDSGDSVLVHGCNCFHRMGSGVAKTVKEIYPEAFQADLENTSYGDRDKLGTFTHVSTRHYIYKTPLIVVNAYTQYNFGGTGLLLDYGAFSTVMHKVHTMFGDKSISMPRIGAGHAHGDWNVIEPILNKIFYDITINIYHLKGEVR